MSLSRIGLGLLALLIAQSLHAQPKMEHPLPLFAFELVARPGQTTKLTIRGLRLDGVTEIRVSDPKVRAKLLGNNKSVNIPNNEYPLNRVGDRTIDIELTLPAEIASRSIPITLIGPGGESPPCMIGVADDLPQIAEKEPNDRYTEAQVIPYPAVVVGKINRNRDIDLYEIEGKAGAWIHVEVESARYGAPVDSILSIIGKNGEILAQDDDRGPKGDAQLRYRFPANGRIRLLVQEANDFGGEDRSPYRLRIERSQPGGP
ncbi:hypothetical protein [Tuwongella immobilis]|uniref:Peptidase domain protein n=1 Tax=Tuwongella immobilis TaxID=692036 RepID=A0A6C2YWL5_9BACT|nr:hypothetical protein [Tuwongella immobilis]VIP05252.1 Peptidase domain protein OS=Pirellula staleyi (strain ATCC 27377 / DSM 6068 / ICPB 4128) GN=Psta_4129 PE=4 SV=1 [Tuwongella immobilis]VTS07860.1 Peptidase domain protein OS=Pirellula staleyi (strain ATCC 27377 / DSM 6068 / ICPB 4128) GN=Psta_4129 PE=4 SV=1 [Tuwongella immobilis]